MSCDCNTLIVGEAGVQGPQGLAGINGTNGTNGINAFTTVAVEFTQPAINDPITFEVAENSWIAVGQTIYISQAGFYTVTSLGGTNEVNATLVRTDGVSEGDPVVVNLKVSPSASATYSDPLTQLTVNGTSLLNGDVTVNENSASYDFRVEGNGQTHLLYTQGSSDQVGIRTSAPAATLDINGTLKVQSTAGFSVGATVNTSQADSDFVVKSQISAATLYVDASTGRVGVGTSSPAKLLDVSGASQTTTLLVNPSGANGTEVLKVLGASSAVPLIVDATNNRVGIKTASPAAELDVTGATKISGDLSVDTNVLKVDTTNNRVGIKTTSPTVELDVTGDAKVSGTLTSGASTLNSLSVTNGATIGTTLGVSGLSTLASLSVTGTASVGGDFSVETSTLKVDTTNNYVGVNTSSPSAELDIVGATKISGNFSVDTNVLKVDSAGNFVGINKTTPAVALDVVGSAAISSTLDVAGAAQANSYEIETGAGKLTKFYYQVGSSHALSSLGSGVSETFTDTVTGVIVGDFVISSLSSVPATTDFTTDVIFTSKVTGTDTVTITVTNTDASGNSNTFVDSITFRHLVIRAAAS